VALSGSMTSEKLKIDVTLGQANVTIEALNGLSVGDVIVLNTTLNESAQISASGVPVAGARITSLGAQASLSIHRLP
jgi:flagellar motor switch protein FliM